MIKKEIKIELDWIDKENEYADRIEVMTIKLFGIITLYKRVEVIKQTNVVSENKIGF